MKNHVFNDHSSNYRSFYSSSSSSSSITADLRQYNCSFNISTINPSQGSEGEEQVFARKRTFDDTNIMSSKKMMKMKMKVGSANCYHEQTSDDQQLRSDIQLQTRRVVTERKGQKLSDKITALQKLVSPYGKTDTASVLEEAFISITALQIQIKNMSLMFMRTPHEYDVIMNHLDSQQKIEDEEQMELLTRMGLCLVPLSAIHSKFKKFIQ